MYNYCYNLISNTKLKELLEITRYKTEVKTISKEVLEVQQEMDWLMRDEISKLVKAGLEAGELKKDIDSDIIIMSVLSYLNGIEDTWLINSEIFPLEKDYKALIDLFIGALVSK